MDGHLAAVLYGGAAQAVLDALAILALSGMRFDELRRLRVADCPRGAFLVRASAANHGARNVPIHSALAATVARLAGVRPAAATLLPPAALAGVPEALGWSFASYWNARPSDGPSLSAHGVRRWFVGKALDQGQEAWVVSAVVGHVPFDATRPWLAPTWGQRCACVESVGLPLVEL
jgi:integrase